tara:strand:- start:763 stop:1068 length:306 start_codon:yes stop_codon:yes gene_type:complete
MRYIIVFSFLFLISCATPHVVDIIQPNDEQLSCIGLQNEVDELDKFIKEAESEKGVNWSNAGRLLVFPIGIWATYENANQAIDAANQREIYLKEIMSKKNC